VRPGCPACVSRSLCLRCPPFRRRGHTIPRITRVVTMAQPAVMVLYTEVRPVPTAVTRNDDELLLSRETRG
jgi:hypothetical protein